MCLKWCWKCFGIADLILDFKTVKSIIKSPLESLYFDFKIKNCKILTLKLVHHNVRVQREIFQHKNLLSITGIRLDLVSTVKSRHL